MKVKVELEPNETIGDAEEFLEKALHAKQECDHGERYADPIFNEAHDLICERFEQMVSDVQKHVMDIIQDDTRTKITK